MNNYYSHTSNRKETKMESTIKTIIAIIIIVISFYVFGLVW